MNTLYPTAREAFLDGDLSWRDVTVKAVLVDTSAYTYDAAHDSLADVPAGARVAVSDPLTTKTSTDGVADADNLALVAVSGATVEACVLFADTGVEGTSTLIAYIDTATGLPVTPNGGNVNVIWDDGANKIFRL